MLSIHLLIVLLFLIYCSSILANVAVIPFGLVADNDLKTRDPEKFLWSTPIDFGSVIIMHHINGSISYEIKLTDESRFIVQTDISRKNRSLELSEIVHWNQHLWVPCDITGIVYRLDYKSEDLIQKHILTAGDGNTKFPLKGEWMTVKDNILYVGSIGKEWVTENGQISHYWLEWVIKIHPDNHIERENWKEKYSLLRKSVNATYPSYLLHESAYFDSDSKRWLFMPRKASLNGVGYNEKTDETMGTNLLLIVDENFEGPVDVKHIGPLEPEFGVTSLKKVPHTKDLYIVTKAKELTDDKGNVSTATKIFLFQLETSEIVSPILSVEGIKYEGIEFLV